MQLLARFQGYTIDHFSCLGTQDLGKHVKFHFPFGKCEIIVM